MNATDTLAVPNSLEFAGVPAAEVQAIDIHRHAAEKFHGMLKDFGERENSRVRDLVDLMILLEHGLLTPVRAGATTRTVWIERENAEPPVDLPTLPETWPSRYEQLVSNHKINIPPYPEAVAQVSQLWGRMFSR